ncbi:FAD:protein FMN transferase [Cohnella hashimotonis]|uniref:FAD:protein FMN transferase n=1 Tax=Cohnella hashimotonis TaxID=2826895 RepID=A0ABT6TLE4_9BACL|nr:FAD:protein FMN transferase [Cohnella hashimotonis]MDI4647651.1 FAD:protein FMN transferase [Cohnella hashimotonis]
MENDQFRAMNTTIVTQGLPVRWRAQARNWFAFAEAQLSRFLMDSELSRLNRAEGRPFLATPLLYQVLAEADRYYRETGGLFSPYLGKEMERLGYDMSFERLKGAEEEAGKADDAAGPSLEADGCADSGVGTNVVAGVATGVGVSAVAGVDSGVGVSAVAGVNWGVGVSAVAGVNSGVGVSAVAGVNLGVGVSAVAGVNSGVGVSAVAGVGVSAVAGVNSGESGASLPNSGFAPAAELEPGSRAIRLRPDAAADLGGIAKGWTARHLAKLARQDGVRTGGIGAGGDLVLWGCPPDGWRIGVADPWRPEQDATGLTLRRGAGIATSSAVKRRWKDRDGHVRHHIVDPRTGRSASTDLAQVTIIAPDAVMAEVYAKCVLLLGSDKGPAWLERANPRCAMVGVRNDGTLVYAGDLETYVIEERASYERIG